MEEKPPDEARAPPVPQPVLQEWPPVALEQDKKTIFWKNGVMECFSSVLSLFNKTELNPRKDDDWEVPFAELTEFVYLGAGAQGIVFRSNLRGEMVAVKKLKDRKEANIRHLRKLTHPNIVLFRGVSTNGPIPCIIMEYCQYGPLFEFLHSGACISATQTFNWAKEIASGMAYLHSHKIIHRDLKSPNILIADNLVVKVSDFGTSRQWDDVSTIMSFTGTVAWMAPEVIRHEPCSERVDVWSYGVVLWELLTQEIPYKNLETHAIMWGVGTDTLSLPIPPSCPDNLRSLLQQCWNRVPRHRPPFKIIAESLAITGDEFKVSQECFSATQSTWREEIKEDLKFVARSTPKSMVAPNCNWREEMRLAKDVRHVYEQQLSRANELYMEVCAVRLQLEQREKDVAEREQALEGCRCGIRKNLKYHHPQTSSSSDNIKAKEQTDRRRKKNDRPSEPAELVVNLMKKGDKIVSKAVSKDNIDRAIKDVTACACPSAIDNNNTSTIKYRGDKQKLVKKDTTIQLKGLFLEQNGNIVKGKKIAMNDNYVPDIAQV